MQSAFAWDMDADGTPDVLAALGGQTDGVVLYLNDGSGSYTRQTLSNDASWSGTCA